MRGSEAPWGFSEIAHELRSLRMAASVLHLGAHPDDEESGLLAYLSRGLAVRAVYWSATRGEGGQNRVGPDRAEALGIIRTWESLSAREIDGGEVLYGPFYDFGFSKNGEHALAVWGRDELVREIVRAIRLVKPLVVISRWTGDPEDGHGHHQAIGLVAREAFEAAGNPGRFSDLGLPAWRPQKMYHSMVADWQPGEDVVHGARVRIHEEEGLLRINTGTHDPVSGRTFQELADLGAGRHATQAMAFFPHPGDHSLYYRLTESVTPVTGPEASFFDGLNPSLTGIADLPGAEGARPDLEGAMNAVSTALRALQPEEPARAVEPLLEGLVSVRRAHRSVPRDDPAGARDLLEATARSFEQAVAACLGLRVECDVDPAHATPGQRISAAVRLWMPLEHPPTDIRLELETPEGWDVHRKEARRENTEQGEMFVGVFEVTISDHQRFSSPYWLREERSPGRYAWPEDASGLPLDPPFVSAICHLDIGRHALTLRTPGVRRETFVGGFRELPLAILPPVALTPTETRALLPRSDSKARRLPLHLGVRSTQEGGIDGTVAVHAPEGWRVMPEETKVALTEPGEVRTVSFELEVPPGQEPGIHPLRYTFTAGPSSYSVSLRAVRRGPLGVHGSVDQENCISEAFIISPARLTVELIDAEFVRTLRYGYVRGAQEEVLEALGRFDLDIRSLSDHDLAYGDLAALEAIVIGPNAYLSREGVRMHASRLLEYVEGGGTLIVQYQGYGYQEPGLAPYPFRLNQPHDRVTDPEAPISMLEPDHPILHLPNEIGPSDFDSWQHDRGLYFMGEWDERYLPILSSADPGEPAKTGGLMVASHGRGTFVYCGYSLHRQVAAGVPGGVRLLANLMGLAEAKIRERAEHARSIPLFSSLSNEQRYEVARLMSERWVDAGTDLCVQGERSEEVFVIIDGEVEVRRAREGVEQVLGISRAGEALGEIAAITDLPRSATLRARTPTRALVMRAEHVRELVRNHPDVAERLIETLARRLATHNGS